MNTRVFHNSVLVCAILLALTGCIEIEFVNPDEVQETEIMVQAPTETPATFLPTDEPMPANTTLEHENDFQASTQAATEPLPMAEPVLTTPEPKSTEMLIGGPELADAYNGLYKGTTVSIFGQFTGEEIRNFKNSIRDFEQQTGIDIQYEGSSQFEAEITNRANIGNLPDIADINPMLLATFAKQGMVVDLMKIIDPNWLNQNYNQSWLDIATMEGVSGQIMAGVWNRAGVKSLVWYPKDDFDRAGYKTPSTWNELMMLTDQIVEDGGTPWCIGIESGTATGWVVTDWIEDVMLRTTSLENYDRWVRGETRFDSSEVRRAIEYVTNIWFNDEYVYGGRLSIATNFFGDAPLPMFEKPPKCWLHRQANWITGFFPEGNIAEKDYDFFLLPSIYPLGGKPVLVTGSIYAAFNDRPEVRAMIQYFSTGDSIKSWVMSGGVISPHNDQSLSWYPDRVSRRVAETLLSANSIRFDGSDMMPTPVGYGSFWKEMTSYIRGDLSLNAALRNIDASWPNR